MNAIERIKEYLFSTDIKDKIEKFKEEDYEELMSFISDKARKEEVDGVACIEDADVFAWSYEWSINHDPNKVKEKPKKEVEKAIEEKPKPKPVKEEVKEIKAKQTDLFGWEQ